MRRGFSLVEVVVAVGLLALLLLGGIALYITSLRQGATARTLLVAGWLAKGTLDSLAEGTAPMPETQGSFPPPFDAYTFAVQRIPSAEPSLDVVTVVVTGPARSRVSLQRLVPRLP